MAKKIILTPHFIFTVTLRLVFIGTTACILFVVLQKITVLRSIIGGVGFLCSVLGGAIAAWFSIRMKDLRCALVAAGSLLSLAFWMWVVYEKTYG
jgi:hypothetical protein